MSPYIDDPDFTLHVGDALEVLQAMPDESVHCCVTSPPYWGLRDYSTDGQLGLEPTPDQYVANMVNVFREVRRVLRADGTLWLNIGDSYGANVGGHAARAEAGADAVPSAWRGNLDDRKTTPVKHPTKPKDLVGIPWRLAFALQQPYYTGTIKDERDRIWLAAMVEAEGCMFIHRRKAGQSNGQGYERKNDSFGAGLEVASTDRVIVERCLAIAGKGSIGVVERGSDSRRRQTLYRWMLRSNECRDIIRELYPHMVAKQHEARLLLSCPSSGSSAIEAWQSLKSIHQGRAPTIDFKPPETLFEPGWYVRSDIVWSKANPMPESVTDRPTKAHEYLFLLTKSPRYFYDADAIREPHSPDGRLKTVHDHATPNSHENYDNVGNGNERWPGSGRNKRSVWEIATEPYPDAHFATFPQALVEPCIKAGTSEHGCCPVCGAPWERETNSAPDPNRPQAKRALEISEQHGLTPDHIAALQACGISDTGKALVTTHGTGRNLAAVQALADEARAALKGYSREFLIRGSTTTTGWEPTCTCLSQNDPLEPHTGRSPSTKEAACTGASPTAEARGSEDTQSTLTIAPAVGASTETEAGDTSTTKTAPNAKDISESSVGSGRNDSVRPNPVPCVVLDPFMGSGTTAQVARRLGRKCVGIELNPEYAELAARRLQQQSLFA